MEENKNLQPETSPEEKLDQLLAEFMAIPDMDVPTPPQAEEEAASPEDAPAPVEEVPSAEPDSLPPLALDKDTDIPPAPSEPENESMPELTPEPESAEGEIVPLADMSIGESLATPKETEEIGVDEQALEAAGLATVEPETPEHGEAAGEGHTASIPILINTTTSEEKEPDDMAPTPAEAQAPDLPEEEEYTPPRKIRPKKKGTYGFLSIPHMAAVVIWLAIIVFVGVGLGNILWEYAADMLAFGRENKSVTITINAGDDLDDVCNKLQSTGLIKYPELFKLYADLTDAMEEIKPGTYTLSTVYDYMALKRSMSGYGARVTTKVVIPEGYTTQQLFKLLESKGVCTVAELEAAAQNGDLGEYWFLEGVERDGPNCLEGYLFPDTYQFYLNEEPVSVLKKLLNNFNKRFNDTMKANLITLNETLSEMMRKNGLSEAYIADHQITVREVVIIASMIEKEAANTTEGYTVSSVIYNRLTNPNSYPYLQIDATLVYFTGHSILTAEDLATDHPYNTYLRPGLIPGPICNPSRASMDAALEPDSTPYYYYALNPATGEHKFSETLAEHDAFLDSLKQNNEETE